MCPWVNKGPAKLVHGSLSDSPNTCQVSLSLAALDYLPVNKNLIETMLC